MDEVKDKNMGKGNFYVIFNDECFNIIVDNNIMNTS